MSPPALREAVLPDCGVLASVVSSATDSDVFATESMIRPIFSPHPCNGLGQVGWSGLFEVVREFRTVH